MSDLVKRILEHDLHWARWRVERLRQQLARAERAADTRLRELARYNVDGTVPRRKGVQRKVVDDAIYQARGQGRLQRKRGRA